MPQLERSNRTKAQVRWFDFGPTLSVVARAEAREPLCSSTYVSVVDAVPRERARALRQGLRARPQMPDEHIERRRKRRRSAEAERQQRGARRAA